MAMALLDSFDYENCKEEINKIREQEKYENLKKKISQELKEELRKEIREEILNEISKNNTLHNKKVITTTNIRSKYVNRIVDKFGPTGAIDSAIRTVATYKMGKRKCSSIKAEQLEEWEEILDFLYKYVLGEIND